MEWISVVLDLCFGAEGSLKANLGAKSLPQAWSQEANQLQSCATSFIPCKKQNPFFLLTRDQVLAACQPTLKDQQTNKTKLFS